MGSISYLTDEGRLSVKNAGGWVDTVPGGVLVATTVLGFGIVTPPATSGKVMFFNTAVFDAEHYTVDDANRRIIVKKSGGYFIGSSMFLETNNTSGTNVRVDVNLVVNGTVKAQLQRNFEPNTVGGNRSGVMAGISVAREFVANDVVEFEVSVTTSVDLDASEASNDIFIRRLY